MHIHIIFEKKRTLHVAACIGISATSWTNILILVVVHCYVLLFFLRHVICDSQHLVFIRKNVNNPRPSWWRHQMETFSALLVLCAGNSTVTGEFPAQSPVTRSFGVFFDLRLNKRLSKQSWGWWFETLSRRLWCHCNVFSHTSTLNIISPSTQAGRKWSLFDHDIYCYTPQTTVLFLLCFVFQSLEI